jgi:protein SCO1/2
MRITIFLRLAVIVTVAGIVPTAAPARIAPADYHNAGVVVPPNAQLPLDAIVSDASGGQRRLRELISRITVLIFADYKCRTLCGPVVSFVASALEQSGLRAGDQFQLVVIGLDPNNAAADASNMRRSRIDPSSALFGASEFVTADQPTIRALTEALGYRYFRDAEEGSYIHPAAAYVLTTSGQVSRVLTGLGLTGADMRLALVEASAGEIGTVQDKVRLLCSAFDPAHGTYNLLVWRLLEFSAAVTVALMAGGIGLLLVAGRRRAA